MASDFSQINALDPNSLSGLRRVSKDGSPAATKEAAKQFEALLLQQVLKSMRDATPKGGMFDSDESRMYQSLLDQQLAMQLATIRRESNSARYTATVVGFLFILAYIAAFITYRVTAWLLA